MVDPIASLALPCFILFSGDEHLFSSYFDVHYQGFDRHDFDTFFEHPQKNVQTIVEFRSYGCRD